MKKKEYEQLSLFDIELPPNDTESIKEIIGAEQITQCEAPTATKPQEVKPLNMAKVTDKDHAIFKEIPTVNELLKMLEKGLYRVGAHEFLADLFESGAIAISNKFDMKQAEAREKKYLQIINKYDKDMQKLMVEIFAKIFILLSQQINPHVGFSDYLGELYMKTETSNKHTGQFFTPYNVSKACAAVTINEQLVKECMEQDRILTLCEPACGSSGMVLAAADVLYNKFDFNISRNLFVEASDIDSRCVHMSYLQLGLAGIPAVIYRRDTLTMETWERWETPAYIMQWLRFRKYGEQ